MRRSRYLVLPLVIALAALAAPAPSAEARNAYILGYEEDLVGVFDVNNLQFGTSVPSGPESEPYALAISPDGASVWVLSYYGATLASLSTASNQFVGASIPVPMFSYGIGITPDGSRAYVASAEADTVEAIDLASRDQLGVPITVGDRPNGISITPDGARVYVSNEESEDVSVIDTATNQVVATVPLGAGPYGSAVTPDGRFVFFATESGIYAIETATNQVVGPPILPGVDFQQLAISPGGSRLYASSGAPGTVVVVDVATRQSLTAIPVSESAEFLALTPDGKRLLVEHGFPGQVTPIDTATNQAGVAVPFGQEYLGQVAVVPDRSPSPAVRVPEKARPGVPVTIDGSSSTDPDGKVASWAWTFGDGQSGTVTTPTVAHTYGKPGKYPVTLKVTDDEGCAEAEVFTGTTAYCSGQNPGHGPEPAIAIPAPVVTVAYPGVKLKCPKSAKGGCKFKLKAVQRKKKGKLKSLSAVARGKAKAGRSVTISVKPKKSSAKKLASAKQVLVELTTKVDGLQKVKVKKLKIVQ
jgi:YVTN family beta-propeller protein